MASSPIWRDHLRPALESGPIAFQNDDRVSHGPHLINSKTRHRIRMVSQDAEIDEEVTRADLVKGYEFEKDHYVLLDDDDFEHARIDRSNTLTFGEFVNADSIGPIFSTSRIMSRRTVLVSLTFSSCCA